MDPSIIAFIIPAFIAGLLTFLAPCTLPLVPAYIGFISGVSTKDLEDPILAKAARKKIVINGVFFVLGFSAVFIFFGALFGNLVQFLSLFGLDLDLSAQASIRIWLSRIGGLFVILFGLFMLGVFNIKFLQKDRRMKMPSFLEVGKPSSSLAIGGAFAFGWTPCVGPILGAILLIASTSGEAIQGAMLLAVFSLGLSLPFLFVAFAFSKATQYISAISKYLKWISVVGGVFLIILGILLMTNNFNLLIQYGFQFFGFIEYEGLLEHL